MLEWLKNQSKCRWWCVLVKLSQLFLERKSQQRGTRAVFKVDRDRVEMTPEGEKAKFHKLVIHHRSRIWFYSVVSALSSACSLCGSLPTSLILRLFALKGWRWRVVSDSWLMLNVFVSAGLMPSGYLIDCWLDVMTATFSHYPHTHRQKPLQLYGLEIFPFYPLL